MEDIKFKLRQTLTFIGLMLGMLVLMMLLSLLLPSGSELSAGYMKLMQMLQTIMLFIVPALLWSKFYTNTYFSGLWLNRRLKSGDAIIVVLLMLVGVPAINMLGWLNSQITLPAFMADIEEWMQQLEQKAQEMTFILLSGTRVSDLLVNLFVIALLPAIGEEMTFRGVLMHICINRNPQTGKPANPHIAIWVCAIIFSFIHFQFYGFIPRMLVGALFGYLLWYSGSLWLPIVAHFTNNAVVVLTTYIYQLSTDKPLEEMQDFGTEHTWWVGLICLVVSFSGFYLLLRPKK